MKKETGMDYYCKLEDKELSPSRENSVMDFFIIDCTYNKTPTG